MKHMENSEIKFLYVRDSLKKWYPEIRHVFNRDAILYVVIETNTLPFHTIRSGYLRSIQRRLFKRLPKILTKKIKSLVSINLVGEVLDRASFEKSVLKSIEPYN